MDANQTEVRIVEVVANQRIVMQTDTVDLTTVVMAVEVSVDWAAVMIVRLVAVRQTDPEDRREMETEIVTAEMMETVMATATVDTQAKTSLKGTDRQAQISRLRRAVAIHALTAISIGLNQTDLMGRRLWKVSWLRLILQQSLMTEMRKRSWPSFAHLSVALLFSFCGMQTTLPLTS